MKATKELIKVDITNYENFWEMLNSPDKENAVVALAILDQADFRESLPYILLLFKNKDSNARESWLKEAPNLGSKLAGISINKDTNLSYKNIVDFVKDRCTPEGLQFTIDKFSIVLKKYLVEWGLDFCTDLDLKLTLKTKEE